MKQGNRTFGNDGFRDCTRPRSHKKANTPQTQRYKGITSNVYAHTFSKRKKDNKKAEETTFLLQQPKETFPQIGKSKLSLNYRGIKGGVATTPADCTHALTLRGGLSRACGGGGGLSGSSLRGGGCGGCGGFGSLGDAETTATSTGEAHEWFRDATLAESSPLVAEVRVLRRVLAVIFWRRDTVVREHALSPRTWTRLACMHVCVDSSDSARGWGWQGRRSFRRDK